MRTRRRLRPLHYVLAIVAVTAAVALGSACTPVKPPAPKGPQSYVALGDSYTSGPLIPNQIDSGCARSDHNYPHLVAQSRRLSGFTFNDVSCSGADTAIVSSSQVPNLQSSTRLVTLTVSGDDGADIGGKNIAIFGSIVACAVHDPTINPSPCGPEWLENEFKPLVAAVAPRVAAVLRDIHSRAPLARVLLLNYPRLLPETGGCFPSMPFANVDLPYLVEAEQALNAMLAQQAAANQATLVDVYTASLGHDACQDVGVRWVEPVVNYVPGSAQAHPNLLGMEGMSAVVQGVLGGRK
jgi:hypothetical protein